MLIVNFRSLILASATGIATANRKIDAMSEGANFALAMLIVDFRGLILASATGIATANRKIDAMSEGARVLQN